MTKKNLLRVTLSIAVLAIGTLIIKNQQIGEREKFEDFLVEEYKSFPFAEVQSEGKEKAMDSPDLAAFTDYIRTLDPEIKAVPAWRLQEGLERSRALQADDRLKSGSFAAQWNHHPTDMGGRTRSLMFDPNDPNKSKVWAGSVTGGLWVSSDPFYNQDWEPVNDLWANLSVSCITYDPNNTSTFYVGTGESQTALIIYRESSGRGTGIMKSDDGGETWGVIPSTKDWAYVTDILVRNEDGQSVIYAGVVSGIYKGAGHQSGPSDGLYRSDNGGESWTQVLPNIEGEEVPYAPSDIETSSDNGRIFVGTTYNLDGKGASRILYSDDGINWMVNSTFHDEIINGRNIGSSRTYTYPGRVMFSNAPSNPDIIYALIAGGYVRSDLFIGYDCAYILKSEDKGQTWSSLNIPMRGGDNTFAYLAWHALVIEVSPYNPNLVWIGGLDTWRSSNGGSSWTIQSNWAEMYGNGSTNYVHADIHAFIFRPGSDTDMLIATDGGIFGTKTASGADPTFYEYNQGYSTLQYYSGAIHPDAGAHHFIGGLQDNGTMFYKKNNIPTFRDMLSGGDGALCFIDKNEPNLLLTTVYHNSIYLFNGDKEEDPGYAGGRNFSNGTFINAMDYNWKDNILFANGMREEGTNPNTLLVTTKISVGNVNGSLRSLDTNSEVPYSCIKYSQHSVINNSTIFIGTQAGKIFKLENASQTGVLTDLTPENFPTANISCIDIGQSEDTLLVTFSNYGVESVWLSVDGGQNWMNKEGNLPDMPVRWALFHPENSNQVMLATELGTWTTTKIQNENVAWNPSIEGMANVRVDQIKMRESDNTVLAATHGRGMYTGIWPVDFTAGIDELTISKGIKVYPNPTNGEFNIETGYSGSSKVIVSDMSGRVVYQDKFDASTGMVKSINISNEPKGIYLVKYSNGSREEVAKLILK